MSSDSNKPLNIIYLTDQSSISILAARSQQSDLLYVSDDRLRKLEVSDKQIDQIRNILENKDSIEEENNVMSDVNKQKRKYLYWNMKSYWLPKMHMMTFCHFLNVNSFHSKILTLEG